MYNGIGLQTARGSGTNGYVQTNKFFVRPKTGGVAQNLKGYEGDQGTAGVSKKANKEILEHDRKRQIELKLVVLEDKLVDQGYTDAEIAEKVEEARKVLVAAAAVEDDSGAVVSNDKVSDTQTHQVAARKEKQMETLRAALGISVSGPDDALELEPGEIKDDKPKGNRKYSRNEEENDRKGRSDKADGEKLKDEHRSQKDNYSDSESGRESEQEAKIKRRSSSGKNKRRKGDYSSSESEREQEAKKKSISRSRKQKRVKGHSSDTDNDENNTKRSRKKSKRSLKNHVSDSDSDTVKKHDTKQKKYKSDSSDSESAEKLKKGSKKKARLISKDTDSDSSSDSSSFDDSSDSDSGPDRRKNVSKRGSKPSGVSRAPVAGKSASGKRASNKYSSDDDSSSESDSYARVAKTRNKLPTQKHRRDTDEDESGSADDDTYKHDMRAKKLGSKYIDDDKLKTSYIEDEGRWENRNSDREGYKKREIENEEKHSKGDRDRYPASLMKNKHDRYEDKLYQPSEREGGDLRRGDGSDDHKETKQNDKQELRDRKHGDRNEELYVRGHVVRNKESSERRNGDKHSVQVKDQVSYRNEANYRDGSLGRSELSRERKSKRDEDNGRARHEKDEDDKHKARRMHARDEKREEVNRRYGRRDIESPKRARYNDVSPSDERQKYSRRHDRSRH